MFAKRSMNRNEATIKKVEASAAVLKIVKIIVKGYFPWRREREIQ